MQKLSRSLSSIVFFRLFFPLCLLLTAACPAQAVLYPKEIKFQHVLENEDIVVGEVRSILQDSQGFMWFGGWNSLVRYDGYDFKHIYLTVEEGGREKLMNSTNQTVLFEASDKTIWVGTSVGLFKYSPEKSALKRIQNTAGQPSIVDKHIMDVAEIEGLGVVVASLGAVFVFDLDGDSYRSFSYDPDKPAVDTAPHHPNVNKIFVDTHRQIWFGTDLGLEKFDRVNRTFTLVVPDPAEDDPLANWVKDIEPDGHGRFWLSTNKGLVNFDPVTHAVKRYQHDPEDKSSLGKNDVWDILTDSKGRLWVTTDQGGLHLYVPERDAFIRYQHNSGKANSLAGNVVRTAFEDDNGDLWVGFYPEGIDFFDQTTTAITTYANDATNVNSLGLNSVLTVSEDEKGNLWLGLDGNGLDYFDRATESFTHYRHQPDNPNSLAANAVLTSLIDSQNVLWLGHWGGGMTRFDLNSREISRIPFMLYDDIPTQSKNLNSRHVWAIYEDSRNDLWVGTHTGGLNKYDRDTGVFTHYWHLEDDPSTVNSEWIWCILEDSKNNFWVGTTNGLALMDRDAGTFTRFEPDPNDPASVSEAYVLSLHEDKKGRLWVGTNVGLNLFNYDTKRFTAITTEDGLNNDSIRTILEDENGVLWLGTANGVSSYNPETGKIKNFNRDGGELVGGFNYGSGVVNQGGEMIFGGVNGLRIYRPAELLDNMKKPPIAFTQLKVFSDVVGIDGPSGILSEDINHVEEIELDSDHSMFELHFSALNFRDSGKNQYAYMLDGFDEEWMDVGTQRSAKYTNLDPGTYTFKVKASNNDGVWNEQGRELTVVMRPPWWKTWWAYSVYLMALALVVFGAIQVQRVKRKQVEELNLALEKMVVERTMELRQKNRDIQSMLEHMRQGLFAIESGGLIHPEYSRYLETIFERDKLAGIAFDELLFASSDVGRDTISQVVEVANTIIKGDEMNYDFNAHLLIRELTVNIGGKTKFLSLDWNPIIQDGDTVERLMVSVRDTTALRKSEKEAAIQKRELAIIAQLLDMQAKKFSNFERSIRRLLLENKEKLRVYISPTEDVVALLFRNMHTIKGSSRTYGFSYLCEISHDVETAYASVRSEGAREWDNSALLTQMEAVEAVLNEYADVFYRVLGRKQSLDEQVAGKGVWLDERSLQSIAKSLANVQLQMGMSDSKAFLPNKESGSVEAQPLKEVIGDQLASINSLAQQLGKPTPAVNISCSKVHFRDEVSEVLTNIFTHIFRNALDHGIESVDERLKSGKPSIGRIDIEVRTYHEHVDIHVRDDGRGLHIERLRQIGISTGRWEEGEEKSLDDIAQIIFDSGVSTSQSVTDVSGRGVGMDAVKYYLQEHDGDIFVNVMGDTVSENGFADFEVIITLPQRFCLMQ